MRIETEEYMTIQRREEVRAEARKLRKQFLRYKEAEIVYSMQHDFITYRMGQEYYGLGEKPMIRLQECAELYSIGLNKTREMAEELADVLNYCILMINMCDPDMDEIVREKIKRNNEKYPVEKAKDSAKKYDE